MQVFTVNDTFVKLTNPDTSFAHEIKIRHGASVRFFFFFRFVCLLKCHSVLFLIRYFLQLVDEGALQFINVAPGEHQ